MTESSRPAPREDSRTRGSRTRGREDTAPKAKACQHSYRESGNVTRRGALLPEATMAPWAAGTRGQCWMPGRLPGRQDQAGPTHHRQRQRLQRLQRRGTGAGSGLSVCRGSRHCPNPVPDASRRSRRGAAAGEPRASSLVDHSHVTLVPREASIAGNSNAIGPGTRHSQRSHQSPETETRALLPESTRPGNGCLRPRPHVISCDRLPAETSHHG